MVTREEKIDDYVNNCTLVAARELTGKSDKEILKVFREHDYKENKGMRQPNWTNAIKQLGIELEPIKTKDKVICGERNYYSAFNYMTLASFIKTYNKGVYLVRVSGHAFVIRNGLIVDPNWNSLAVKRRVLNAWKVLNAPFKPRQTGTHIGTRFFAHKAKRVGTEAYVRFAEMHDWIFTHPERATLQEVVKNTSYTRQDYLHDLKKGLIYLHTPE